jgi:HAD superfamily hydrolase (TIGR01549 family)
MKIRAVLLDFGDTLADQATEERDEAGLMTGVELIPGARELLDALRERGLPLGLVVDGAVDENWIARVRLGLEGRFDAIAISEDVGAEKPDPRPYERALDELGVAPDERGRVVMVGNRLERDVRGARALGLIAVWLNWSERYRKRPRDPGEVPDFIISEPLELLDVLDELERQGTG